MISAGKIEQTTDPRLDTKPANPILSGMEAPAPAGDASSPAPVNGQHSAFLPSDQLPRAPEAKGLPLSRGAYGTGNKPAASQALTIEITPEILAYADILRIPHDQVPLILNEAGKTSEANIAKIVEERFTPERLAEWLDSDKGREWYEANQNKIADTMRNRLKIGAPGLLFGIAGLLGAEQVADVIGLHPLYNAHERFAFVIYSMHTTSEIGRAAGEAIFNRPAIEILKKEIVEVGGKEVLKVSLMPKPLALHRAVFNALGKNFAGKTAAELAKGAFTMPFSAVAGLGPGLASAKIFDSTIAKLLPEGAIREWSSFGAFFIPDICNLAARNRLSEFLVRYSIGRKIMESGASKALGIGTNVFAAAFALDLGTMAFYRLLLGSGKGAYQQSVNMRIQQVMWREDVEALGDEDALGKVGYGAAMGIRKGLEWLMASYSSAAEANWAANPMGHDYALMIHAADKRSSADTRKNIRALLLGVLIKGFGDESNSPEFYKDIDLSVFYNEIDLEDKTKDLFDAIAELEKDPEFKAKSFKDRYKIIQDKMDEITSEDEKRAILVELNAKRIQGSLAFLYFMHINDNDDIRKVVNENGVIRSADSNYSEPGNCGNEGGRGMGHNSINDGAGGGSAVGGAGGSGMCSSTNNDSAPVVSEEQEDAFLRLAFPHLKASEIRDQIFILRKTGLLIRILNATGSKKRDLLKLAEEVGLTDDSGELKKDSLYFSALDQWSIVAKEEGKGEVYERYVDHKHELKEQIDKTPKTDEEKRALLNIEYMIMEDGLKAFKSMIAPEKPKAPTLKEQQMEIMAKYFDAKVNWLLTNDEQHKHDMQDRHYEAVAKGVAIDYSYGGYKMLIGNGNGLYMEALSHWAKLAKEEGSGPRYENYVAYKTVMRKLLESTPQHDENYMLYLQEYGALTTPI